MSTRIPVTVIAGAQGSGKTALLNHWSARSELNGAVVLSHSLAGLNHPRAYQVSESVYIHEAGCLCCAVQGDLVLTLQRLFLDALHRKIPVFTRIIIEASGRADPATFKYLVEYERFLADRYVYAGCLALVDVTRRVPVAPLAEAVAASGLDFARSVKAANADKSTYVGIAALVDKSRDVIIEDRATGSDAGTDAKAGAEDAVVRTQIRSADVLLLTHTDRVSPPTLAQIRSLLHTLKPEAACHCVQTVPDLAQLFEKR